MKCYQCLAPDSRKVDGTPLCWTCHPDASEEMKDNPCSEIFLDTAKDPAAVAAKIVPIVAGENVTFDVQKAPPWSGKKIYFAVPNSLPPAKNLVNVAPYSGPPLTGQAMNPGGGPRQSGPQNPIWQIVSSDIIHLKKGEEVYVRCLLCAEWKPVELLEDGKQYLTQGISRDTKKCLKNPSLTCLNSSARNYDLDTLSKQGRLGKLGGGGQQIPSFAGVPVSVLAPTDPSLLLSGADLLSLRTGDELTIVCNHCVTPQAVRLLSRDKGDLWNFEPLFAPSSCPFGGSVIGGGSGICPWTDQALCASMKIDLSYFVRTKNLFWY